METEAQAVRLALVNCYLSGGLLLLTFASVVCAFIAYYHQKNRAKKDAACKLARVYADEVLPKCEVVNYVMRANKLDDFIKETFPITAARKFSYAEFERLAATSDVRVEEIKEKFDKLDEKSIFTILYVKANPTERKTLIREYVHFDDKLGSGALDADGMLRLEFGRIMQDLLNLLEWFAMNCRYGLADEKLIYQSLHQTYLSTVWGLYYNISSRNLNNKDKFYTNAIWLFNRWADRVDKQEKKAKKRHQKAQKARDAAQAQMDDADKEYVGSRLH